MTYDDSAYVNRDEDYTGTGAYAHSKGTNVKINSAFLDSAESVVEHKQSYNIVEQIRSAEYAILKARESARIAAEAAKTYADARAQAARDDVSARDAERLLRKLGSVCVKAQTRDYLRDDPKPEKTHVMRARLRDAERALARETAEAERTDSHSFDAWID